MIKVNKIDKQTGNVYILFGHEAIQARPNLDPYTSTLRMKDETMQVYTVISLFIYWDCQNDLS